MGDRIVGGIQSLDAALHLLKTLAGFGGEVTLTDLSRAAGMPATKAHRYLTSFVAAGMVEQRERSGRYGIGPGALSLGLAAMARLDGVNRAADALPELVEATGSTALISVWGDHGATIVRWQRAAAFAVTTLGLGTTLPLLNSATGRICLAYLPKAVIANRLRRELAQARKQPNGFGDIDLTASGIVTLRESIRSDTFAGVDGRYIPGLAAIAAPVLDWQHEAVCIVTLIGTDARLTDARGDAVSMLTGFCRALSS